jgi:hypothetical protein
MFYSATEQNECCSPSKVLQLPEWNIYDSKITDRDRAIAKKNYIIEAWVFF